MIDELRIKNADPLRGEITRAITQLSRSMSVDFWCPTFPQVGDKLVYRVYSVNREEGTAVVDFQGFYPPPRRVGKWRRRIEKLLDKVGIR